MTVLPECLCTVCVPGACGNQTRTLGPLELELHAIVSLRVGAGKLNLGPLKQPVLLLTNGPFLQPCSLGLYVLCAVFDERGEWAKNYSLQGCEIRWRGRDKLCPCPKALSLSWQPAGSAPRRQHYLTLFTCLFIVDGNRWCVCVNIFYFSVIWVICVFKQISKSNRAPPQTHTVQIHGVWDSHYACIAEPHNSCFLTLPLSLMGNWTRYEGAHLCPGYLGRGGA